MSSSSLDNTAKIKRIKISNFKSFKDLDIELDNFNVIIGTNSAGKSSFVQIFQFLKDIEEQGLDNAISLQGGVEYLRNVVIGSSNDLSIEVVLEGTWNVGIGRFGIGYTFHKGRLSPRPGVVKMKKIRYEFALAFQKVRRGFKISRDNLEYEGTFPLDERDKDSGQETGKVRAIYTNVGGKLLHSVTMSPDLIAEKKVRLSKFFPRIEKMTKNTLILQGVGMFKPLPKIADISIYDFDAKLSKKSVHISGKADLESDANNLPIVLKKIINNTEGRRKFSNLIRGLLPYMTDVKVKGQDDRSLLFNVKEKYYPKRYLPASLISDGTINITALILALYFDTRNVNIIEEPERNLHPQLIASIVSMMRDVSSNKQIIITTHNPEIVRQSGIENLLLIRRNKEGYSTVTKPSDMEQVKQFLKDDMDLSELYIQNLLVP